jgi:hypothetical protein
VRNRCFRVNIADNDIAMDTEFQTWYGGSTVWPNFATNANTPGSMSFSFDGTFCVSSW